MPPSKPNLEISTVVGCRVACSFCPQKTHVANYAKQAGHGASKFLLLDDFKRCLETVPTEVEIVFAGMAEPWLNTAATYMVLHAVERGHTVAVYTTTVGMTPVDIELLHGIPFKHFCIHLPDNAGQMHIDVDSPAYLRGLRAAMTVPGSHFTVIGELNEKLVPIVGKQLNNDSAGLISRAGNLTVGKQVSHKGKIRCGATAPGVMDHNVLLPNGDVVLCCCDYSLRHNLGNLLVQDYASLFNGIAYRAVMHGWEDDTVDTICRRCELAIPA
jgi:hypothetical protein